MERTFNTGVEAFDRLKGPAEAYGHGMPELLSKIAEIYAKDSRDEHTRALEEIAAFFAPGFAHAAEVECMEFEAFCAKYTFAGSPDGPFVNKIPIPNSAIRCSMGVPFLGRVAANPGYLSHFVFVGSGMACPYDLAFRAAMFAGKRDSITSEDTKGSHIDVLMSTLENLLRGCGLVVSVLKNNYVGEGCVLANRRPDRTVLIFDKVGFVSEIKFSQSLELPLGELLWKINNPVLQKMRSMNRRVFGMAAGLSGLEICEIVPFNNEMAGLRKPEGIPNAYKVGNPSTSSHGAGFLPQVFWLAQALAHERGNLSQHKGVYKIPRGRKPKRGSKETVDSELRVIPAKRCKVKLVGDTIQKKVCEVGDERFKDREPLYGMLSDIGKIKGGAEGNVRGITASDPRLPFVPRVAYSPGTLTMLDIGVHRIPTTTDEARVFCHDVLCAISLVRSLGFNYNDVRWPNVVYLNDVVFPRFALIDFEGATPLGGMETCCEDGIGFVSMIETNKFVCDDPEGLMLIKALESWDGTEPESLPFVRGVTDKMRRALFIDTANMPVAPHRSGFEGEDADERYRENQCELEAASNVFPGALYFQNMTRKWATSSLSLS